MLRRILAVALLTVLLPLRAHADGFSTLGPHFGFSSGPDQVVFGGQLEFGGVAPDLDFVPGVDFGFGDHLSLISLNGDFHYRFHLAGQQWQPYAGAGVGLHFISYDNLGPGLDGSATKGGGHFIVGADVPTKSGSRFFAEIKLGFADSPDFKALAGWNFKLR